MPAYRNVIDQNHGAVPAANMPSLPEVGTSIGMSPTTWCRASGAAHVPARGTAEPGGRQTGHRALPLSSPPLNPRLPRRHERKPGSVRASDEGPRRIFERPEHAGIAITMDTLSHAIHRGRRSRADHGLVFAP